MQAAAWRAVLSDAHHLVIADHAGSGKTLAYLAPLLQAIRKEDAYAKAPVTLPNTPRLVVITPTEGARMAPCHLFPQQRATAGCWRARSCVVSAMVTAAGSLSLSDTMLPSMACRLHAC